jgi:hypothetical protein
MAVPPIIHAEHRVVRGLRDASATGPESAAPVAATRMLDGRALHRLLHAGVVREAGAGRYWLEVGTYRDYRRARRTRALMMMGVAVFVVLVIAYSGLLR